MASTLERLRAHRSGAPTPQQQTSPDEDTPVLVGAYDRISAAARERGEDARYQFSEEGVDRQWEINQRVAERRGWTIHDRYSDNNRSAFKKDVIRENFQRMVKDLQAGVIQGIICYNMDRLVRRIADLEVLIDIYEETAREGRQLVFATQEGLIDISTPGGRAVARIIVAIATSESEATRRRMLAFFSRERDKGILIAGAWRPFGWNKGEVDGEPGLVINPGEAALIRDAVARVSAHAATWQQVADEWNSLGFKTTRGKAWLARYVREVLTSPRLAGWCLHKGQIAVHSETGELIRARNVQPILTDEELEAILAVAESKRQTGAYSNASGKAWYMLSGLLRCAECGARMRGNVKRKMVGGQVKEFGYYRCGSPNRSRGRDGLPSCGRTVIQMTETDALIEQLVAPIVAEAASDVEVREEKKPYEAELEDLRRQVNEWLEAARTDGVSPKVIMPHLAELDRRINELSQLQSEWARKHVAEVRMVGVTQENWPDLSVEERRAYTKQIISAIYISPAGARQPFSPDRVSVVWRTESESDESLPSASR